MATISFDSHQTITVEEDSAEIFRQGKVREVSGVPIVQLKERDGETVSINLQLVRAIRD